MTGDIIFSAALPEEVPQVISAQTAESAFRTITTRVGKASAAYRLTREIMTRRPRLVINIGSAGSCNLNVGDLVVCSRFVDRDLQPLSIEGVLSDISMAPVSGLPSIIGGQPQMRSYICNTGDDFVTGSDIANGDVIDMESFALAMVCREEGVPFVAVKYITDRVGQNSVKVWADKLRDERQALSEYVARYILISNSSHE